MHGTNRNEIQTIMRMKSHKIYGPTGTELSVLEDGDACRIAAEHHETVRTIYIEALKENICPHRYIRNQDSISVQEQLRLAQSAVSVIGAGGLGGHVIVLLARIGIGLINIVDHDFFDESNMNRQLLCTGETIGLPKASVAINVVHSINPGVDTVSHQMKIDPVNIEKIISGSDIVVDALDTISDRFVLEGAAKKLNIPMVHGALAGFEGRIMTILPGDQGLRLLYDPGGPVQSGMKSPEMVLGVPAVTPAVIAALQVIEVIKILLNRGNIIRNKMMYIDLEKGELQEFLFQHENVVE